MLKEKKKLHQKKKSKETVKIRRKNKQEKKKKKKKALYAEKKLNDRRNREEKDKKVKKFGTLAWAILSKILPHIFFRVFTLYWSDTILMGLEIKLSNLFTFHSSLPSQLNTSTTHFLSNFLPYIFYSPYSQSNQIHHKALWLGEISSHLIGER